MGAHRAGAARCVQSTRAPREPADKAGFSRQFHSHKNHVENPLALFPVYPVFLFVFFYLLDRDANRSQNTVKENVIKARYEVTEEVKKKEFLPGFHVFAALPTIS